MHCLPLKTSSSHTGLGAWHSQRWPCRCPFQGWQTGIGTGEHAEHRASARASFCGCLWFPWEVTPPKGGLGGAVKGTPLGEAKSAKHRAWGRGPGMGLKYGFSWMSCSHSFLHIFKHSSCKLFYMHQLFRSALTTTITVLVRDLDSLFLLPRNWQAEDIVVSQILLQKDPWTDIQMISQR